MKLLRFEFCISNLGFYKLDNRWRIFQRLKDLRRCAYTWRHVLLYPKTSSYSECCIGRYPDAHHNEMQGNHVQQVSKYLFSRLHLGLDHLKTGFYGGTLLTLLKT